MAGALVRAQAAILKPLSGISAGHADPCAPQCLQQGLKLLVGRLIDREGIVYAGLPEDDVAVAVLVRARNGDGKKLHVEAPHRATEDFNDATIESDDAVRPGRDFEHIHDGEGTRRNGPLVARRPDRQGHLSIKS